MKKSFVIFIFLFVAAAGSSVIYVALKPDSPEREPISAQTQTPAPNTTTQSKSDGKYISYEDGIITKTSGKKLLFFYAPWCSQCRSIEAGIVEQGVPDGVTIIKVDYDSNQTLRKEYGVTLQTTFVSVDDEGTKTDLYVAYNEPTFDAVKRDFIKQ